MSEFLNTISEFKKTHNIKSTRKSLIDTNDLTQDEINFIIHMASYFKNCTARHVLSQNKYTVNLFFEPSTRTKSSFMIAQQNLGINSLDFTSSSSSTVKGETILDTLMTYQAMGVELAIIRHQESGIINRIYDNNPELINLKIINAGDGTHAHPTQALLDLVTIQEQIKNIGDLKNYKFVIVGDILHSRVAKSNLNLLSKFGVTITFCGPETLVPDVINDKNIIIEHDLSTAVKDADFIMTLRIQSERQKQGYISSLQDYAVKYQINKKILKLANKNVKILHPGPVNRDIEIASDIIYDSKISLIQNQVANSISTRMAVISLMLF